MITRTHTHTHAHAQAHGLGEGGGAGSAGESGECLSLKESQAEKHAWHQAALGLSSSESHDLLSLRPRDHIRGLQEPHVSSENPGSGGCLPARRPLSAAAAATC